MFKVSMAVKILKITSILTLKLKSKVKLKLWWPERYYLLWFNFVASMLALRTCYLHECFHKEQHDTYINACTKNNMILTSMLAYTFRGFYHHRSTGIWYRSDPSPSQAIFGFIRSPRTRSRSLRSYYGSGWVFVKKERRRGEERSVK